LSKLTYKRFTPSGIKKGKDLTNSSRLLISVAEEYGVKWKIINGTQIVILNYNGKEEAYYHQVPSTTTAIAIYCDNKKITRNLLKQAGVSVANGYAINKSHDKKYLLDIFEDLKKPLVVKPSDGTWGENITIGVSTYEEYSQAVELALSYSTRKNSGVIIEEMFLGEEYRILLTKEKVIGVLKRIPANVTGNGKDNIKKLIATKNKEELRSSNGVNKSHLKIIINEKLKKYLADQNLDTDAILKKGQRVFLKKVSNVSQGGDAIDFTDLVHSSVKEIALKAIRAIPGLSFAGLDFMSTDITKEQTKDSYIIVEINASPGFDIHDFPYEGKNRHATREFLFLIFPELRHDLSQIN